LSGTTATGSQQTFALSAPDLLKRSVLPVLIIDDLLEIAGAKSVECPGVEKSANTAFPEIDGDAGEGEKILSVFIRGIQTHVPVEVDHIKQATFR
jgi:hypothetical protein